METKSTFIIALLLLLAACSQASPVYTAENQELEGYNLTYTNQTASYTIRVMTPTPCYNVTTEESMNTTLSITAYVIPQQVDLCSQVVDYKQVSGQIIGERPDNIRIEARGQTVINETIQWQPIS